jgi:PKHD-type hydroxylase
VAFDSSWWLYRWTHPFIHEANKVGKWNFQWNHSEACQLTEYKPGGFYHWHKDQMDGPYDDKEVKWAQGKIRKLSSVVSLNEGTEYTGGELEFYSHRFAKKPWHQTCKPMKNKGSIVVFPSFMWHRVMPVKTGVRYSLTNWHLGDPFV